MNLTEAYRAEKKTHTVKKVPTREFDPGSLVLQSNTLTTRLGDQVYRGLQLLQLKNR